MFSLNLAMPEETRALGLGAAPDVLAEEEEGVAARAEPANARPAAAAAAAAAATVVVRARPAPMVTVLLGGEGHGVNTDVWKAGKAVGQLYGWRCMCSLSKGAGGGI